MRIITEAARERVFPAIATESLLHLWALLLPAHLPAVLSDGSVL